MDERGLPRHLGSRRALIAGRRRPSSASRSRPTSRRRAKLSSSRTREKESGLAPARGRRTRSLCARDQQRRPLDDGRCPRDRAHAHRRTQRREARVRGGSHVLLRQAILATAGTATPSIAPKIRPRSSASSFGSTCSTPIRTRSRRTIRSSSASPRSTTQTRAPMWARMTARPEIYAYGFRNPWSFNFDPTGRIWVGDVGQASIGEEIGPRHEGRRNYGWYYRCGEGLPALLLAVAVRCPRSDRSRLGLILQHVDQASQVTGGYVYAGSNPALQGLYLLSDYISGRLWSLWTPRTRAAPTRRPLSTPR